MLYLHLLWCKDRSCRPIERASFAVRDECGRSVLRSSGMRLGVSSGAVGVADPV